MSQEHLQRIKVIENAVAPSTGYRPVIGRYRHCSSSL
jgi:hypothetical protein